MASFAKAQLLKYGWTEGKGLGKNENGIVDALKPKLKFDTTGIGHDAKEFKWWESVYDRASSNVAIERDARANEISVTIKTAESLEISTKKPSLLRPSDEPRLGYGNFLKTCTLDNGKVVREKAEECVTEAPAFVELTDEQIFQACGGRTAHKGARHGLKLSGKLARIARQEAIMLGSTKVPETTEEQWTEVKGKRKKSKRKRHLSVAEMDVDGAEDPPATNENEILNPPCASPVSTSRKSSKKKKKQIVEERDDRAGGDSEKTIETVDGAIITLEDDTQDALGLKCTTEADRANNFIRKSKVKKIERKAKKRLDRLSDSLMAVSLSEDSVEQEAVKISKKLKKRRRKKEIGKLKSAGIARLNLQANHNKV